MSWKPEFGALTYLTQEQRSSDDGNGVQEKPCPWKFLQETALFLWKDWPMDMFVTTVDRKNAEFTLTGTCPHCTAIACFVEVTSKYKQSDSFSFLISAGVMQCQSCRGLILGLIKYWPNDANEARYFAHYPLGKPSDKVSPEIPTSIAADFSEAIRCMWVNAYNATVEMCRRAIESSCIDKLGAEVGKYADIKQMIDALADKGIITATLKDVAHKIRLGGNRGAHSPKDPAEPVIDADAADAVVEFSRHYFDHIYVVPAKLAKFDFSKSKTIKKGP